MPAPLSPRPQAALPGFCQLAAAVEGLSRAGVEERGAIFTRREVVDFILDLVGYTIDRPLHRQRLLEPSFGGGDFLLAAVDRLLSSYRAAGGTDHARELTSAIRAVELHQDTFARTSEALASHLFEQGLSASDAKALCAAWLVQDDFLLTPFHETFTHIVGNPPYIRQELIPQVLIDEYRQRYSTIYDRADIYIPFIERSLGLLAPEGTLTFICADRWTKNRYGGPLRKLIADHFHLRAYVDMVDTPAFHSDVIAYPAIFVIGNDRGRTTRIAHRPVVDREHLTKLARALTEPQNRSPEVIEVPVVTNGAQPWLLDASDSIAMMRRLEERLPTLEEAGCKVGIGVATGADQAFIGPLDELDVEPDRKLPLVMTRDILSGSIEWRGLGVVNPFAPQGGLVRLEDYPRLGRYLDARRDAIAGRHVAQKAPASWYRTIDRIYPELVPKPKLLIPDIKGDAHIVYDEGSYYPHHNLYYITSEIWDLRALQAVLLSGIARLFIAAYSTKMRGGYLRFQAQYLRRIRVPYWQDVPTALRDKLVHAGRSGDPEACNAAVAELYELDSGERTILMPEREAA